MSVQQKQKRFATTEVGRRDGRMFRSVRARLFGAPELPETIGPYRVLRQLGAGGMGVVYEAYDPKLARRVAVKVLFARDARSTARFRREGRAQARLSHANVVQLYEVGRCGDSDFIAMELVHGSTLRRWLYAPRTLTEIAAVMLQAGVGLAAAHRAGLIHRDFKPDNVLVGADDRVRVADFGLAKPASQETSSIDGRAQGDDSVCDVTRTGTTVGTPAYMGPEQFAGAPATAKTDQFAFCVVLYEALFGRRPFGSRSVGEAHAQMIAGIPERAPTTRKVPARLYAALRRGLSADAAKRFDTLQPLLDALAKVASPPRRARERGFGRRWPRLAAAIALAVGVGASVVAESEEPVATEDAVHSLASSAALVPTLTR